MSPVHHIAIYEFKQIAIFSFKKVDTNHGAALSATAFQTGSLILNRLDTGRQQTVPHYTTAH